MTTLITMPFPKRSDCVRRCRVLACCQDPVVELPTTDQIELPIKMQPSDFIDWIRPYAEQCAQATQLPLAGILAVPALETGWGVTLVQAGVNTYNLFNIKGEGPAGSFNMESTEWLTPTEWERLQAAGFTCTFTGRAVDGKWEGTLVQRFCLYHDCAESYAGFYALLRSKPRYSLVLHAKDPFWFCTALQRTGYATDPHYAEKLHSILRKRVLPALGSHAAPEPPVRPAYRCSR